MNNNNQFTRVFNERVRSLIEDHYCKRVDCRLPHFWIVRLKHMSNGNEIRIVAYPHDGRIVQYTNHVKTHDEVIL